MRYVRNFLFSEEKNVNRTEILTCSFWVASGCVSDSGEREGIHEILRSFAGLMKSN